ncbi:hypothetical protein Aperf_G00000089995 [Anoplocephala perfoliata]
MNMMCAGVSNKKFQRLNSDDGALCFEKRRKLSIPQKYSSDITNDISGESTEPIDLARKIDNKNQQVNGSQPTSPLNATSDAHANLAAQFQKANLNLDPSVNPVWTPKRLTPMDLHFSTRRAHFPPSSENNRPLNRNELNCDQKFKSFNPHQDLGQSSKGPSFNQTGRVIKNNTIIFTLLANILEIIPRPEIENDGNEMLNTLYSQTLFQFQMLYKTIGRYLVALNEKITSQPRYPNEVLSIHSTGPNVPGASPPFFPFLQTNLMNLNNVSQTISGPENPAPLDLRVRHGPSNSEGGSSESEQNTPPQASSLHPGVSEFRETSRLSNYFLYAHPRRPTGIPSYPNEFAVGYPPCSFYPRYPDLRSPPRYFSSQRPKTPTMKSRKQRNIGGYSPSTSMLGQGEGQGSNLIPSKKTSFRGTSEEENEVSPNFIPSEQNTLINLDPHARARVKMLTACTGEFDKEEQAFCVKRLTATPVMLPPNGQVILSDLHPTVMLPKEVYQSLIIKSSGSATRLIRLLMKSFFSQEELAASSLSGEGIYKQRLQPEVTEAIKAYIKKRHPHLKNGSINLCMTDVCVQARRVANNQRSRVRAPKKQQQQHHHHQQQQQAQDFAKSPLSGSALNSTQLPTQAPLAFHSQLPHPSLFWSSFKGSMSPQTAPSSSTNGSEHAGSSYRQRVGNEGGSRSSL